MTDKKRLGFTNGPAISNHVGKLMTLRDLEDMLQKILREIFTNDRDLFPPNIVDKESLGRHYQSFRTWHRTSDTQALEAKVSSSDIDVANRWRTIEEAQGKKPGRSMRQYYAQVNLLLEPFLKYTRDM
mmetsp:Transcript_1680/g.2405  ORF Transcript_1680/g.2405 Transcript_1680/m.2405 type:complete len:128 (-) Transcript_1680:520-903(-)